MPPSTRSFARIIRTNCSNIWPPFRRDTNWRGIVPPATARPPWVWPGISRSSLRPTPARSKSKAWSQINGSATGVAPAEASGIDSASVDLILVAQALHWFDLDRFFTEAKRVLKDDGVLAISSYKVLEITPEVDVIIWRFYRETTGPFWPPERDLVETDYNDIQLPFPELPPRQFEMRTQWNLNQLLGYLRTWSATQRFIAARGFDPVNSLVEEIGTVWKNPEEAREIKWPLYLRVGVLQKR